MQIHWIAAFLDPSFRDLSFVHNEQYRLTQNKAIKSSLVSMANELKDEKNKKQSKNKYFALTTFLNLHLTIF